MLKKSLVLICIFMFIPVGMCFANEYNMTYIYGGSVLTQIDNVKQTNGIINEVSPSYFDLNSDGSLKLTDAVSTEFISNMHNINVRVVPFLSNHWDRQLGRNALENREQLVNEIVNAIKKYNLDGINVDIENVTDIDRENYTDLVRMLREKLENEKAVSVAVAANPKGWITGWHGSYDYKELAKYSDYLMIMTYDEHYQGGTSGPVASYEFVEDSIKYALKYVESNKLVLGLPFFGRYWNENNEGGRGVSLELIDQILLDYNSTSVYDKETKSMKATINVSEEQAENDKYIFESGIYTFWYENNQTIKEKYDLVEKYDLKGTGSWSLGQELSDLWKEEFWNNTNEGNNEIIKEKPQISIDDNKEEMLFSDIDNSKWSYEYIKFAKENNLIVGDNNKFRPNDNLTRAEAVTIISRLIHLKGIKTNNVDNNIQLEDIDNHWAYNDINNCVKLGLIKGYEDNTFRADKYITREEMICILNRLNMNIQIEYSYIFFNDIDSTMWSYDSIISFAKLGLIKGYEDNTFRPDNNITREEIASIIFNICKY